MRAFLRQFPVGLASRVPCLVSRVFPCVSCSSLGLGWFGLLLVYTVVRCLVLYPASPRRAAPSLLCFSLLSFLLVLFLLFFLVLFLLFFSLFLSFSPFCFDSQPQTPGGSVPSTIFYVGGNQNKLKSYKGTSCERKGGLLRSPGLSSLSFSSRGFSRSTR